MPSSFLERIPDLPSLLQERDELETTIAGILHTLSQVDQPGGSSLTAAISAPLNQVSARLDIDVSGLATDLPQGLTVIRNALPEGTLEFVESLDEAYSTARDFLTNSSLVQQIPEGSTLEQFALAAISAVLAQFRTQLGELSGGLVDAGTLASLRDTFTMLENLRTDFTGHSSDLLPFLSRTLCGVGPDLLVGALAQVEQMVVVFVPLQPAALEQSVVPAQAALAGAIDALAAAVDELDPASAAGYTRIQATLTATTSATETLASALAALYAELQALAGAHIWNTMFDAYRELLSAIPLEYVPSVDDLIDEIATALEALLAGIQSTFDVNDLRVRIELLNTAVRDLIFSSGIMGIRQTLIDFIGEIEHAIDRIPTAQIEDAVEAMLSRVGEEIAALDLDRIGAAIESGFQGVERFISENLNDALTTNVHDAMAQLLGQVQSLPFGTLVSSLNEAITQLQGLTTDLQAALNGQVDRLNGFLAELEQLSFKPTSDAVISEIDDIKQRLQAINPNALSEAEKLALKAALATLQAIDLETRTINGLKSGYNTAEQQVTSLLNATADAFNQLRDQLRSFSPEVVIKPINDVVAQISALIDRLNGRVLLRPLYNQVDSLTAVAASLSPAQFLNPLQGPYSTMMSTVQRLDPSTWIAPLESLYADIDRLINFIDVTPLLDQLNQLQQQLFAEVRTGLLAAIDNLHLPEPLQGFFAGVRPVLEGMTEALFGDTQAALQSLTVDLRTNFKISSLFEPLDAAFDQLIDAVRAVPAGDLTAAMNALREGLGAGVDTADPRQVLAALRRGQSALAGLSPNSTLGMAFAVAQIQVNFNAKSAAAPPARSGDIAAVNAQFGLTIALTDSGAPGNRLDALTAAHDGLLDTLRTKINQLDASGAQDAYRELRQNVDRLAPDFLRSTTPLTYADVLAGLFAMRPSAKTARLNLIVDRFLLAVRPLEATLEATMNNFFGVLRELMTVVNPLAIKDAMEDVYASLRTKVRVLDPAALENSLRENCFAPLLEPLEAINPAHLQERLTAAYEPMVSALTANLRAILDSIVGIVDEQLRAIRGAVSELIADIRGVIQTAVAALNGVIERLEALIFVEILERLNQVLDNLGASFAAELDRVRVAFDAMLDALPSGSASGGVSASVG